MLYLQVELCGKKFMEFLPVALKLLPYDVPQEKAQKLRLPTTVVPPAPKKHEFEHFKSLAIAYSDICLQLTAYIQDLSIEAQNQILGSLFRRRVSHREPEDPNAIVITSEPSNIRKMEKYIREFRESKNKDRVQNPREKPGSDSK